MVFSAWSFYRFALEKSVQKQAKTASFAKQGLQSGILQWTIRSKVKEIYHWTSTGCGTRRDLSAFLGLGVKKCRREDLKRFWEVSLKRACQQKRHLAYILSI